MTIRVLVVDDSALVRKMLTLILSREPGIEVVGSAADPYEARDKIKQLNPHVITLDVEMPKMDGLAFLGNLMRLRPMPVVMVSSLTERGAEVTMQALQLGAVDFVAKPKLGVAEGLEGLAEEIVSKVRAASVARVTRRERPPRDVAAGAKLAAERFATTDRLIAVGASTGGTEALAEIFTDLPPDCPAIVIAQHIPEVFSARFAERLDRESALAVSEAKDGELIVLGHAYVAPGNWHLRVERSGAKYYCRLGGDERVNRHRPSVDVLFASVATNVGRNAVGVLLTGMGDDGAEGLKSMRDAGSATIAQDRETSLVWGMPGEAVKRGAATEVLPLERVAERMLALARR